MERTDNGFNIKKCNRKFGLLKSNRPIDEKIVSSFKLIILNGQYRETQSIVTMEATELAATCEITDLNGNSIPEHELSDYLIILDGQHRVTAFHEVISEQNEPYIIPNVHIITGDANDIILSMNTAGRDWNLTDKTCTSAMITGNKLLKRISELVKSGFNTTTASLIVTGGKKIGNKEVSHMLMTNDTTMLKHKTMSEEEQLERAEKFLNTAMHIDGMTTKKLTVGKYINSFNSFADIFGDDKAFAALSKVEKDDLKNTKSQNDFTNILNEIHKEIQAGLSA